MARKRRLNSCLDGFPRDALPAADSNAQHARHKAQRVQKRCRTPITDFDMTEIKKEESEYVPLPKFYKFKSKEERERILYKNFVQVGEDVKAMIKEIQQFRTMM